MKILGKVVITGALLFPTVFGIGNVSAASNDDIIEYSKNFIGTPYVYGGTTTSGFDCSGFLSYVYEKYDISIPRRSADQYSFGQSVDKESLQPGDAVFFNTSGSNVSHAGIYIGDNNFIHASTSQGVRINNLNDSYWENKYVGAQRFKEFTEETQVSEFRGLEVRSGQIGVVEITKPINLWKRDNNNKLEMVRVLNPGEKYRVYTYDDSYGGQYGLGGTFITNMKEHIKYYSL